MLLPARQNLPSCQNKFIVLSLAFANGRDAGIRGDGYLLSLTALG